MFCRSIINGTRILSKRCIHICCKSNTRKEIFISFTESRILLSNFLIKRDFSSLDYLKKIFSVKAESINQFEKNINELTITKTNVSWSESTTLEHSQSGLDGIASNSGNVPLAEIKSTLPTVQNEFSSIASESVHYLPPPPEFPEELVEAAVELSSRGEATFNYLDIISYSPVGLALKALEFVYNTTGLPWWAAISIVTVCLRLLVFPIAIKGVSNGVTFGNHSPKIMEIQTQLQEAKMAGDNYLAMERTNALNSYMTKHNISYGKMFISPLLQAPIFISMFLALRRAAELPVESFKTGGIYWFVDLTMMDPYYILPATCAIMTFFTLKYNMETGLSATQGGGVVKYMMYIFPLIIFPVTARFPAALLCYWVTTNTFTFFQTGLIKTSFMQKTFNIPKKIHHPNKGVSKSLRQNISDIRSNYRNQVMAAEITNRLRTDGINFRKAGQGPIPKTYSYNPLEVKNKRRKNKTEELYLKNKQAA